MTVKWQNILFLTLVAFVSYLCGQIFGLSYLNKEMAEHWDLAEEYKMTCLHAKYAGRQEANEEWHGNFAKLTQAGYKIYVEKDGQRTEVEVK